MDKSDVYDDPKQDSYISSNGAFRMLKELRPKNFEELIQQARKSPNSLLMLQEYLSMFEIPCYKYFYTVNGGPNNNDKYKATFGLSKDYKTLIINNHKPIYDYKDDEQQK